jgi:hypothetical protein
MSSAPNRGEKSLGAAAKFIIGAGAVATALGAIVAFISLLAPDDPKRLRATISELTVDPKVTLAEYIERTPQLAGKTRKSMSSGVFVNTSYVEITQSAARRRYLRHRSRNRMTRR